MRDAHKDALAGAVLAGVAAFALIYIQFGPGEALQVSQDAEITFRTFPTVISLLLLVLSGSYCLSSLFAAWRMAAGEAPEMERAEIAEIKSANQPSFLLGRVALVLALLIGFSLSVGLAPLLLLASVFLFIAFAVFGNRQWGRMAIVAIIGGGLFHSLFVLILRLPLG